MLFLNPASRIKATGCAYRITAHDAKRYAIRLTSPQDVVVATAFAPQTGSLNIEQVRERAEAGRFGPTSGMHKALSALADCAESLAVKD